MQIKLLESSRDNYFKKLFKGVFWHSFASIGTKFFPFILTIIMTRYLTLIEFGELSFMLAMYTSLMPITDIGLTQSLQKFVYEYDNKDYVVITSFFLRIFISIVIGIVCIVADFIFRAFHGFSYIVFVMLLFASFQIPISGLNAKLQFKKASLLSFGLGLGSILLTILFLYFGLRVTSIAWGQALSFFLIGIVAFKISLKAFGVPPLDSLINMGVKFSKFGFFVMLTTTINALIPQVGIFALTWLGHPVQAGMFRIATTVASPIIILGSIIILPLQPILAEINKDNKEKLVYFFQNLIDKLNMLLIPTLCIGLIISDNLIIVIAGTKFSGATLVFKWILFSNIFYIYFYIIQAVPLILNEVKLIAVASISTLFIIIFLNTLLTNYFQLIGAGISILISNLFSCLVMCYYLVSRLKFKINFKKSLYYFFSTIIVCLIILVMTHYIFSNSLRLVQLAISIIISIIVYPLLIINKKKIYLLGNKLT